MPNTGIKNIWIARIHCDIAYARLIGDIQRFRKRYAAVERNVHPALGTRPKSVSEHADHDVLGILRIENDARNTRRIYGKCDRVPATAAIDGLIKTALGYNVVTWIRLARAEPQRLIVVRIDRNCADGCDMNAVGYILPGNAAVHRFPRAAAGRSRVVQKWVRIAAHYC